MEMMVHPAAWRCGYYLSSGSGRFYKDTNNFIFLEYTSNMPVGNGSSFKALVIKPTTILNNITIIDDTLLFV
jgi:hypothetical protein